MFYPGDHARRGRLDRPQIFPHCFHKIAQIACELFLAKGAIRAIGYMETRLGAAAAAILRGTCLAHGIAKSRLMILQKIKPSSTFLKGF